ncbi:TPA: hypothetical protein ACH3X1_007944 [Trebouxia sp. C0004]
MDEDRLQDLREKPRPSAQLSEGDDEAELLRLQREFVSGQQRPAAKATRIVRKAEPCAPPASKPATPNEQLTTNHCGTTSDDFNGLLPGMLGILTNVQEKPALGHVAPPCAPAGGAAFPKATHRKLSKFSLSRQQPKAPQPPGHAPNATLPESSSVIPPSAHSVQSSPTTSGLPPSMQLPNAASGSASAPASAAASPSVTVPHHKADAVADADQNVRGLDVSPADQRRIDEENRQLVNSMSPAEIEEARLELMSRLSPSAQAFLAKRAVVTQRNAAMARAATRGDQPATTGGGSATARADPTTAAKQAATAGQQPQSASNDAAGNASKAGSAVKPSTAGKAFTSGTASDASKAGTTQTSIAHSRHASSAERDTGANSNSIASADVDVVGRLRFSLEGQVVGLKAVADAARGPGDGQQVVQRDILRQSEGSSPQGYTLQEACMLARSSVTKQRVLALRILAAVLAAARPQASHQQAAGVLMPQPVKLPLHLSTNNKMLASITWLSVWELALQEVQVATVLRRLLDDAHMSVVTAAAEAMAVLVGLGPEEEEVWEAARCNPGTGCPSVPWRYCARPHPVGAWVSTPVGRDGPEPPGPGLVEEQPPDDGRVATADPLIGLLGMQVLERISFLLRSPAALSATTPLLVILQSYIRAGADAARAVWQCPGMQKALQGLLQEPTGSLSLDRTGELSASALSLVRMLASSDSSLFTAVMSSGLLMHAQRALAVATTSSSKIGDQLQHFNLQVEALHVWRLCADHNEPFMHLDDAYAAICRLFSPPLSLPPILGHTDDGDLISNHMGGHVGVPHGSRAVASKTALLHKLQLQASCQAFLLLGSLVRHANRNPENAMLSPGSATALVNDALEWLQPQVLQMLPRGVAVEGPSRRAVGKAPEMFCSALAAVLSFLAAHVTARQAPRDISSISKALLDSCVLPRDAPSPQLLSVLAQCSAPHTSAAQNSAASDSDPQKQKQDSAPQGSAARALPVPQSSAGACELLLAAAYLGQTLAQHKALDAQILDSLNAGIISALSGQVLTNTAQAGLVEVQPWTATWFQQQMPRSKLLLHALEHINVSSLKAGDAQQAFQIALALPAVLPPGAEALALRALSSAFRSALLGPVLAAACQALQNLKDSGSSLALAAAGVTFKQMLSICDTSSEQPGNSQQNMHSRLATPNHEQSVQSMRSSQTTVRASPGRDLAQQESAANACQSNQQQQQQPRQPWQKLQQQQDTVDLQYPLEPLPDDTACCQCLLQGYSAAWLGLVPAGPSADARAPGGALGAMQQTEPLLLRPAGSRLPLPGGYCLMEITHPTQAPPITALVPAGVKSNQPLDPIPEEGEAQAEQGSNTKAAAEAADRADDLAALTVSCALLLQLGLEETSAPDNFDGSSPGAASANVLRCFLYCGVILLRREQKNSLDAVSSQTRCTRCKSTQICNHLKLCRSNCVHRCR